MKKTTIIIFAVVLLLAFAADLAISHNNKSTVPSAPSSSTNSSSTSGSSGTPAQTPLAAANVDIKNFDFTPKNVTVKLGATVTWVNSDTTAHTVTGDTTDGPQSATLQQGEKYQFQFNNAGTFQYHCNFHSNMTGTVTVVAS